jgi:ADP-ribose pyrophosphatase YjhB (NUDIX family)
MISPIDIFQYCPRCGEKRSNEQLGKNPLHCSSCNFTWFFNPTCAAGIFLFRDDGKSLLIRRAKDPRKGTLAIPGGFIDAGESAEVGLRREVIEEVGLEVHDLKFVCSCPNRYEYKGITYDVCDFIFTGTTTNIESAKPLDGVLQIEWHHLEDVNENDIAFPSIRMGRAKLIERKMNKK